MAPLNLQLNASIDSISVMTRKDAEKLLQKGRQSEALSQQIGKAASLCTALQKAATQLEQLSRDIFISHREQIVRLSIEIAAKILAKDIHQRNYDIETIVLAALERIPAAQRMTIRLHPDDLEVWQEAVKKDAMPALENVLCIGDSSVQRAECIVETDQGVVEYLIEEQLKHVTAALLGTEIPVETAP